jgi:hypothetical protein
MITYNSPVEPLPEPKEPEWKDEPSSVIHAEASNFASILKTKKHCLVFFYAPCKIKNNV